MKRFWTDATYGAAPEPGASGYAIFLDGKPVRLPGGPVLCVPSARLAQAVAEEWRLAGVGKGGEFSADDTPLTRLAGTAQMRIAPDPEPIAHALARYAESDLLCYRAAAPDALVHRQARRWQPWLDWAALTYDAPLKVTFGVIHIAQSHHSLNALRRAIAAFDPLILAGLGVLVPSLGSVVLALAVADGRLDAAEAHELGALDTLFQAELWGQDHEAVQRLTAVAADIAIAGRFIALARSGPAA